MAHVAIVKLWYVFEHLKIMLSPGYRSVKYETNKFNLYLDDKPWVENERVQGFEY